MGRPTNSAPTPSQLSNQQYNRPLSSTGGAQVIQQHVGVKGPIIMRNLDKPSGIGTQVRLMKTTTVCLGIDLILFRFFCFFKELFSNASLLSTLFSKIFI